ncbi:MAG: LPS export ABC transporter permease LptF [Desulfuromonadia bacterium]
MPQLIDRYLLREMVVPFALGLFGLNGVLLTGKMLTLAELVIDKGVDLSTIADLVISLLPSFLLITIPMSFLLAVLLAFGRLSADSEIIALKASGVSLHRLLLPVMFFALGAFLATLIIALSLLPAANRHLRELMGENLARAAGLSIQEGVFNDRIPGILLYCQRYDQRSKRMEKVMLRDQRGGKNPAIVVAQQGSIEPAEDRSAVLLRLAKGSIHQRGEKDEYRVIAFDGYRVSIPLPGKERGLLDDSEMTLAQLEESIRQGIGDPRYQRELHLQIHKRFALPVSCFIFGIIGISLGIVNRRSGKGGGFTLSLAVFVSYFVIFSFTKSLGQKGVLPPVTAIWSANILFSILGITLYLLKSGEYELRRIFRKGWRP